MSISIGPSGITMNDTLMNLVKGWFVVYKDGTLVTENQCDWNKVKKPEIHILGLKWGEKYWSIKGKSAYIQFKRGSVPFRPAAISNDPNSDYRCEARYIGYYEGAKKVLYRVDELSGRMTLEVR